MEWFKVRQSSYIASKTPSTRFELQNEYASRLSALHQGVPVTVLLCQEGDGKDQVNRDAVEARLQALLAGDDVMCSEFTKTILLAGITEAVHFSIDGSEIYAVETAVDVRSGPYYARGSHLHHVYKLQEDPFGAFMIGILPDGVNSNSYYEVSKDFIPLPSRHYYDQSSAEKPLSGKRIGVKDIFDIQGVATSASSRDFNAFYGAATSTSPMVQRLIDAGAVLVGKTKTSQFTSGEYAHDWVDYLCPFNPRGDGYMEPDCSSTGSAAAIAGYDWLDYALGSDTLGSIVGPAALQGIFGLRPTHGTTDMTGIVPVSSYVTLLDTIGPFARSIVDMQRFAPVWYKDRAPKDSPKRLLYPERYFETWPASKCRIIQDFVADMEKHLAVTQTPYDLREEWKIKAPEDCARPLEIYLQKTLAHIQLYDAYHNRLDFKRDFKRAHGREPYANPMIRFKWSLGEKLTYADYQSAGSERAVFRRFLREHVFDEHTIMVLPAGSAEVRYRDIYDENPQKKRYGLQGFTFSPEQISYVGGLPELVVPVGQVPGISAVTGAEVFEPVCVAILGAPGMDLELMRIVEKVLRLSNRSLEVQCGANAFEVGTKAAAQ